MSIETSTLFIVFIIFIALSFDFTNGFHDAANSIATIVATGILSPKQAVLWAAFFNFIALFFFKNVVANTLGTELIRPEIIGPFLIFSALCSAIIWNIITWYYGLPTSSSHALIGGLTGAALIKSGIDAIDVRGFIKIISAILFSPLISLVIGLGITLMVSHWTRRHSEKTKHKWFKFMQLLSSAMLSLTHGGNDAQKTMGIIAVLLYSSSWLGNHFYIPKWVEVSCYIVISLGTLTGGWRIVHTLGNKITNLNTLRGCCAETSASIVIFAATELGLPVSTTHTVTGSIIGVGLSQSFVAVYWPIIYSIFITWILTIPATAILGALLMKLCAILT